MAHISPGLLIVNDWCYLMLMMLPTWCLFEFPATFLIPKKQFWKNKNKRTMGHHPTTPLSQTIIGTKEPNNNTNNQDFFICHIHEIKKNMSSLSQQQYQQQQEQTTPFKNESSIFIIALSYTLLTNFLSCLNQIL